jgi:proton-dependent oligopeptide transporter, POT family
LILIVCGTGLLKPNISAIVGDLYPEGGARRDAGFSIFYMGINTGAFAGQLVAGALGENVGWHWGFGCAGVGMLLGLITFSVRQRNTLGTLGLEPSKHPDPVIQARQMSRAKLILSVSVAILATVVALAATGVITVNPVAVAEKMTYVLVGLAVLFFGGVLATGNLTGDEKKRLLVIFVLFVFSAIFWGAFEQAPTSLNLFARDFTDREFFGRQIPATAFQSVNSAFIILFAPIFAAVWVAMARRGRELSSPGKFAFGLAITGVGFGIMIIPAYMILNSGGTLKVSPWWLVVSYLFQTFGELAISPVGLSSMTKLSPRKYVGQMMGIWFLATSVGNLIAGLVGGSVDPEKLEQAPALFIWTTVALVGSAVILALLAIPIRKMMRDVPAHTAMSS